MPTNPNKMLIFEYERSNMARFRWTWRFYLTRLARGGFSLTAKNTTNEPPVFRVPAKSGIIDGVQCAFRGR